MKENAKKEPIDLVDLTGNIKKYGVDRDDKSAYDGLYMQIIIVVLTDSLGRLLVHERGAEKSYANYIDHVCGGIISGETPLDAALRESREEAGVEPTELEIVRQGLNSYNRYWYLFRGHADGQPIGFNTEEVVWADYYTLDELRAKNELQEFKFVDGFFEDVTHALGTST